MAKLRNEIPRDTRSREAREPGAPPEDGQQEETRRRPQQTCKEVVQQLRDASSIELVAKVSTPSKQTKHIRLAPLKAFGSLQTYTIRDLAAENPSRESLRPRPNIRAHQKPTAINRYTAAMKCNEVENDAPWISIKKPMDTEKPTWFESLEVVESSDEELPSPRLLVRPPRELKTMARKVPPTNDVPEMEDLFQVLSVLDSKKPNLLANLSKPNKHSSQQGTPPPGSSSDKENDAVLRYTPPRFSKPGRRSLSERSVTPPPPPSPSKSKLISPSKRSTRIPAVPLSPSLDRFWAADTVNNWNDLHSPQKILKSPRKLKSSQADDTDSPTASPRKSQSPFKRTKAELERRRDFNEHKTVLAESFLAELDQKVTQGNIERLAVTTGGVKLAWSKTLNSTAGRANWRRETTKTRASDGTITSTTHKHFATIELAEKVIDDEHRLLNVIAHEFCHLANFMISGIKDQPHGQQFKAWGKLCTQAFGSRGVEVTTKHAYEIEYRYIWQCSNEDCGIEYKRHSRSIDPSKHTCGRCRKVLVQIKPVPRKASSKDQESRTGGQTSSRTPTGYAAFFKLHFASLKRTMPGASHKEVMEALGRKYRAEKHKAADQEASAVIMSTSATTLPIAIDLDAPEDANADVNEMAKRLGTVSLDAA